MKATILPPTPDSVVRAAEAIQRGEVVAMPTETVYGLAGSVFNTKAIARIFKAKERPTFDPLIVHVPEWAKSIAMLRKMRLVGEINAAAATRAEALMKAFWPGALTLILPKHPDVPDLVTSGLSTVALRMPRHPVAQALLDECLVPLAAPSANRFGRISPTTAAAVEAELGERIEIILDGGPCEIGVESTILALTADKGATLLRPGGIAVEEIERVIQAPVQRFTETFLASPEKDAPAAPAPGMLESHYAPGKPLYLLPSAVRELKPGSFSLPFAALGGAKLGLMIFAGDALQAAERFSALCGYPVLGRALSRSGDPEAAAQSLFSTLRELDSIAEIQAIFAEPVPSQTGLGHAIADRLRRASVK